MTITSENYVENVLRTDCVYDAEMILRAINCIELLHGAMGMVTEAGELIDMLKKHIFYGKKLDCVNAIEEVGDETWYVGKTINALSKLIKRTVTMNEVLTVNIDKLKLRYPEKFDSDKAINRDVGAERSLLDRVNTSIVPSQVIFGNYGIISSSKISKRGNDFLKFATEVLNHIENYTVPQYGDKGQDQATTYKTADHIKQAKKYIDRYGKNSRPGQEILDLKKACHYLQMGAMCLEQEMKGEL